MDIFLRIDFWITLGWAIFVIWLTWLSYKK